jgi:hypothetical protein
VLMTVAMRAMQAELGDPGLAPLAATTHFCSPVPAGPLEIRVEVLRKGNVAAQVRAALSSTTMPGPGLEVSATFGRERPGGHWRAEVRRGRERREARVAELGLHGAHRDGHEHAAGRRAEVPRGGQIGRVPAGGGGKARHRGVAHEVVGLHGPGAIRAARRRFYRDASARRSAASSSPSPVAAPGRSTSIGSRRSST